MIQGDERSAIGNVDDATADIVKDIAEAMPPKGIETMKAAGNAAEGALSKDRVRRRAYEMWDADGRPSGDGKEYWLKAEEEVRSQDPRPKGG